MLRDKPLTIATRTYFWKPAVALFRAIELEHYRRSKFNATYPILDLGCGDGTVAHILREAGLLQQRPIGIDISRTAVRRAKAMDEHLLIIHGDANHLPFQDNSFASIMCNGVLCSVPNGVERALSEINRVLMSGGVLVATVPTDKFADALVIPDLLSQMSERLRASYVNRWNRRHGHHSAYSPERWKEEFEKRGLTVESIYPFFFPRAGLLFGVLAMHVFRIFGLLRSIRNARFAGLAGRAWSCVFRTACLDPRTPGDKAGYVLIVGKKTQDLASSVESASSPY